MLTCSLLSSAAGLAMQASFHGLSTQLSHKAWAQLEMIPHLVFCMLSRSSHSTSIGAKAHWSSWLRRSARHSLPGECLEISLWAGVMAEGLSERSTSGGHQARPPRLLTCKQPHAMRQEP